MEVDGTSDIHAEALGDGNTVPCIPEAVVEEELNEVLKLKIIVMEKHYILGLW